MSVAASIGIGSAARTRAKTNIINPSFNMS